MKKIISLLVIIFVLLEKDCFAFSRLIMLSDNLVDSMNIISHIKISLITLPCYYLR